MKETADKRYIDAYETYIAENGDKARESVPEGKELIAGYYLSNFGANALEEFKKSVSGNKPFNYQKMNASQKEVYSALNYVQNSNEREQKLREGVDKLMDGDEYMKYLEFTRKFHTYSFNNALLIYMQKPDATYVAGFTKWKSDFEAGGINKGEKGIMISRPNVKEFTDKDKLTAYLEDPKHAQYFTQAEKDNLYAKLEADGKASLITSFSYVYVWDVSQLHDKEGKPLKLDIPDIRKQIGKDFDNFEQIKDALIAVSPVDIKFVKSVDDDSHLAHAYGYYSSLTNSIAVRDVGFNYKGEERSEQDCIRTTIHEIAHSMLHGKEMKEQGIESSSALTKSQKEIEAESVAFMVCDYLGIDSSCNSFGYLASYLPSDPDERFKALEKSMKRINKCAETIIDNLDKELEKAKAIAKEDSVIYGTIVPNKDEIISVLEDMQYLLEENIEGLNPTEAMDLYDLAYECLENVGDMLEDISGDIDIDMSIFLYNLETIADNLNDIMESAEPDFINSLDVDIDDLLERTRELTEDRENNYER